MFISTSNSVQVKKFVFAFKSMANNVKDCVYLAGCTVHNSKNGDGCERVKDVETHYLKGNVTLTTGAYISYLFKKVTYLEMWWNQVVF